VNTDEYIVN